MRFLTIVYPVVMMMSVSWPAAAWTRHDLITQYAVKSYEPPLSSIKVLPETLEHFVQSEREGLIRVFDAYYDYALSLSRNGYGSNRVNPMVLAATGDALAAFLRVARMNPKTVFSIDRTHVNALDVLSAYADEPDNGFDQDLWPIKEYGFRNPPYGEETGERSQAAFHMQFLDESYILRLVEPEIINGMAFERMSMFLFLARYAHSTGHSYWGYRFTSWALHYLEDICQPYHAKAAPYADLSFYLRYIFSSDKAKIRQDAVQLVSNRHFAFEDFAGEYVSASEEAKAALAGQAPPQGANFTHYDYTLFRQTAIESAQAARELDQAIRIAFGPRIADDPAYDYGNDKNRDVKAMLRAIPNERLLVLKNITKARFEKMGHAVRILLRNTKNQ